ncbi:MULTISPECIES: phosphotransferase [Brachybacterium]|uniref:Aminoglycoside phosphotransferase n=1 Tax=Brachybacterium paraconglomeratum TaxID=173362 RepID=A0A426SPA8_9MICO|nr:MULTISPECIES: phosphotransferase [Brachybacterium]RRR20026.1 aminoglycoside phosphotransferase [Brachybacterium paraconglomeratum]
MRTAPASPTAAQVLEAVRRTWLPEAEQAIHLPLGFGAHHWRIDGPEGPTLFATLDRPSPTRSAGSFTAAYLGARELRAGGLPGVLAPCAGAEGRVTIRLDGALLSVTPWREGRTPTEAEAGGAGHAQRVSALLDGLHEARAPEVLRPWAARVSPGLAARLEERTGSAWTTGPMGETARALLRGAAPRIREIEVRYRELVALESTRAHRRVPTHGEPHHANQLLTADDELLLVDWETLALAPLERDLAALSSKLRDARGADPAMSELFDLEWTLSEVEEYMRWFSAPHMGTEDDEIALQGLRDELN